MNDSLDLFALAKLEALEARHLRRRLVTTERLPEAGALRGGRRLISFSCNDYLGLSQDPRVKQAAAEAIARYGTGAGAARLVTGDCPLVGLLEAKLARRKGKPAGLVFGSGYLVNIGVIPTLVGADDLVLADELAHSCLMGGARLSRARVVRFRHNDVAHARALLAAERAKARHAMIATERVFSMDGDQAPVAELAVLAAQFDAWLLVDDAHGLGVIEPERFAPLEMGTLSKALGSYGGYLCASQPVIDLMTNRARSFVYTTGLPPASAAAALAALSILECEPERCARPLALARRFSAALGLPAPQSAIAPIRIGDAQTALQLSRELEACGFLVVAIRPPTVPEGTARLRVAFSAAHSEADVDRLAEALRARLTIHNLSAVQA